MPEEYTKLAEGIIKGSVPMVASFVERYVSEDEPGFFVGDREHVEDSIRVHVTVFAYLERANAHLPDSTQLGVVDLQQLPDERVWMVVGGLPGVLETEGWLNDLYSAMIRRMAARLVQFGFLDAPHRPRLRAASTMALSQVAQALKPPKPAPVPESVRVSARPVTSAAPTEPPVPQATGQVQPVAQATASAAPSETPAAQSAPVMPPAAQSVPSHPVLSPASEAATPSPEAAPFTTLSGPQLDIVLTVAMVLIWLVACGMLSYLLFLLLR